MNRVQVSKMDTAEYPSVKPTFQPSTRGSVRTTHSAKVRLADVTFDAVQEVFSYLATFDGDPKYLFVAEDDLEVLSFSIMHARLKQQAVPTQILNQATKRLVHIVPLPDLPAGTVMAGFFGA